MARIRAFAGMKWKFFGVRKRRERTFIHNLCPLCGRRRGASSADRVGRDPCVPPQSTHCSRRGTRAPPYRVRRSYGADRVVRPYVPCHCAPVRAAKQVPLGYRLARQSVFPALAPLDKPVGMGIIINTRGRCDKRSAPSSVSDLIRLYSLQKPSLSGVAVFVFQLHNTNRNGIPPDVESKYPVHVCHPLSGL